MKTTKKQQYKEQVWAALTDLGYIGDIRVRHYNVMCSRIDKGDKTGLWKAQFGSKHGNYYRVVYFNSAKGEYAHWEGWENHFPG